MHHEITNPDMYPYLSPSGGGMTPSKELAERMEKLREEYTKAVKAKDHETQSRILKDEKELVLQIGNAEARRRLDLYDSMQKSRTPRFVSVTEYYVVDIDTGSRSTRPDVRQRLVYLDTHEVEMIWQSQGSGPTSYTVRMRSGREFDVNEVNFNQIERAMLERES